MFGSWRSRGGWGIWTPDWKGLGEVWILGCVGGILNASPGEMKTQLNTFLVLRDLETRTPGPRLSGPP